MSASPRFLSMMPKKNVVGLNIALAGEMITPEEHRAILNGDMYLERNKLMNLNVDIPGFPTGTNVKLYYQRGVQIQINRLLGLMDNGKPFPQS